jgi:N-acetyltransferase 10
MKKKLNQNNFLIRKLFFFSNKNQYRSILLLIGEKSKEKIPFIHYLWSKSSTQIRSDILWCYQNKNKPSIFNLNHKKYFKKKKEKNEQNFFNLKMVRYCLYKDTKKLLGNSFSMVVLEDFENITPNSLARIIETVEGGGTILFLLETINSLKNVHSLSMEIYKNFQNQIFTNFSGRFIDRFFLSLRMCETFLPINDDLKILPFFSKKLLNSKIFSNLNKKISENLLMKLIKNLGYIEPLSSLISKTKTFDQARAFLIFTEAIADKKKWSTVILTSSRGRGKSATLGLSITAAIAYGYSNIFITAPDPDNLNSFFAFLFIGLKALGYIENQDYEVVQNPILKNIDKIYIFSSHRQIIKFIYPFELDIYKNQIELLIIEEAAGISSQILNNLMGPYLIFISSTTSGYEGYGRALNLKMIKDIKLKCSLKNFTFKCAKPRIIREIILNEPIRYSSYDPVEKWLYSFLCLDLEHESNLMNGFPDPEFCNLFLVDRNALFSGHKFANCFLQKVMGVFISSHFKNSPDDLQMLCDAPSHRIFVLITPLILSIGFLPDILCALHICYEGQINKKFVANNLSKGIKFNGDLIPWVISKQFCDPSFSELSGLRIIRISTHPDSQCMGYGTKSLEILNYFSKQNKKKFRKLNNWNTINEKKKFYNYLDHKKNLSIPILINLDNRVSPKLDYIGVSFSLSLSLFCFWKKNGFILFVIRSFKNKIANEYTVIMLKLLKKANKNFPNWYFVYQSEFLRSFISFLNIDFGKISTILVKNIIESFMITKNILAFEKIKKFLSPFDFKKIFFFLKKELFDYYIIIDIFPILAKLKLCGFFPKKFFSSSEKILLISIGLQFKSLEIIKKEFSFTTNNFAKVLTNILKKIFQILEKL